MSLASQSEESVAIKSGSLFGIVICTCIVISGCGVNQTPSPSKERTESVPTARIPTLTPTITKPPPTSTVFSPTPTNTSQPPAKPDLTNLVVTLEDLPNGFVVQSPGLFLMDLGEVIPMINQEVERKFTYADRKKGQIISGVLFITTDFIERAASDAMMPFAVEVYVDGSTQDLEGAVRDDLLEDIDLMDLADVAVGRQIVFGEEDGPQDRFEALMFRRGVVGAFIMSFSVGEAPSISIEEVARILDDRIRETVPNMGWMTEELAALSATSVHLISLQSSEIFCGFVLQPEGFNTDNSLNVRLTRPDGSTHFETEDLEIPFKTDDIFSFELELSAPTGLWIFEFHTTTQAAAYAFQWTGECREQ